MQLRPSFFIFEKVITLKEQYLYGSKRLGVRKPHLQLAAAPHTAVGYQTPNEPQAPGGWFNNDCMCYTYEEPVPVGGTPPPPPNTTFTARFYTHTLGKKEYEITNHLGNVLATVLDRKTGVKASPTATTYAWFKADVSTAQDYYPFGSLMPGRTYVAPTGAGYRFGFNGMQRDDEIKGPGNSLDFGARMYDSRLGRWMSVDAFMAQFPTESPYLFSGNNPVFFVDKDGNYKVPASKEKEYFKDYPMIMKYLSTQIETDIAKSEKIIQGLMATNPNIKESSIKGLAKWGYGPEIEFVPEPGEGLHRYKSAAGYKVNGAHTIQLNSTYAKTVEDVLASNASEEEKLVTFTRFYMTLIHETAHELNVYGRPMGLNSQGHETYVLKPNGVNIQGERGDFAEEQIWGTSSFKPFTLPKPLVPNKYGIDSEKYSPGVTEQIVNEAQKTEEGKRSLPTVPSN